MHLVEHTSRFLMLEVRFGCENFLKFVEQTFVENLQEV